MLPLPWACMARTSCFMLRTIPRTFVSNVAAKLSAVWSVIGPPWPSVAALFTATSRRPNRATVLSTRARTSSSLRTSALMNSASEPKARSSLASNLPASSRRPETTTFAPFVAKAMAAARPMPVSPPVIKTTGLLICNPRNFCCPTGRVWKWNVWPRLRDREQSQVPFVESHVVSSGAREKDFVSWGACPGDMEAAMELRHLRYFIAVAEEGSLTVAAEKRLHTAQPSLSRQIRDLEYEVGVQLMSRSVHGIELTAAGRAFLDHARLALTQAEAAKEAARRAARPAKPTFALGFLTGKEIDWLPEAMRILHDELSNIEFTVSSQNSPDLADALMRGRLDAAFMRPEERADDLIYRRVITEPFVVMLPSDHRLARHDAVDLREIVGETFIIPSKTAPTSRAVIEDYLKRSGLAIVPTHEVDNITHAMSMIASTGAVALLPAYPNNLLPWSVTSRPIRGDAPTIDLVVGYNKANRSPILKLFLSRIDDLSAQMSRKGRMAP